jgi:lysine/ornithine N-monooxygenase
MENNKNNIAVIGGGVSGITALKYLKDKNLKADLFEGRTNIAGLWNPVEGFVWNEMTTNLSQYNNQFSDFFWPIKEPYLPPSYEVYKYIESYSRENKLDEFHNIKLNSYVNRISKTVEGIDGIERYSVEVLSLDDKIKDNGERKENYLKKEIFIYENVIVCTGVNNDFKIPKIENFENYKGEFIHSSQFKCPSETVKKYENILVVGAASSSINIIEHLNIAKKENNLNNKLTLCFRNLPYLYMSDFIEEDTGYYITNDARFFKRKTEVFKDHYMDETEVNLKASSAIEGYSKHAETHYNDLLPLFEKLDLKYGRIIRVSAYKELFNFLKNKELDLQPIVKRVVEQESKEIEFANNEKSKYDLIIFGTGYNNNLKFIDREILNDLDYSFDNYFYPMILYKGIFHNKHKGLFFLGTFCRQYITGGELQAEYIASIISKEREYPSNSEFEEIIEKEKLLKRVNDRFDVPWFHTLYWDSIAYDLGCFPDFQRIKQKDKELYDVLIKLPVYGFQYRIFKNNEFVVKEEYEKLRNYILSIKNFFK